MKINTLRARLALWIAALLLLALAIFGVYVYSSMARGLYTAVDNDLALNGSQVIAGLNIDNGKLILPDSLVEPPETAGSYTNSVIRIISPDGRILLTSSSNSLPLPNNALPLTSSFITWTDPTSKQVMRIYSAPVTDNNRLLAVVQVARSLQNERETLQRLLATLFLGIPILVIFAAMGGYFLAARALAPIDTIIRTARRISAEDLSARLNLPPGDDEVGRLAATFDDMLARLDDSFRRERQFTDDASHELRTPLAAMQAILSVIRSRRRTPQEYELALDDLNEESTRLSALTEDLLLLARGKRLTAPHAEPVDLSELLPDLAESLRPIADAKSLTLETHIPAGLTLLADSDSLIRLFVNLLDNAIKFTEHGGVTLNARNEGQMIIIDVADTGPGIIAENLPNIFNRFYRADASRTYPGSGLGLAIAQEIARAHNGDIKVRSIIGKGSTFTVRIPLSQKKSG